MNFTYYRFLLVTTFKKRPIWITWMLYLLTCIAFLIILPGAARLNTVQIWANTTMAVCQTFLGMTVAIFTAVLGIHIFKDGVEEGTELIVISKPISRKKIVLTKFIIFFTFCLFVNISAVIISFFTIFLPTTEIQFYAGLLISMFIGNLVCFGVFGAISILLTVKFAKVGVIITNIMISLIFLIYQCLTLFVFQVPMKSLSEHNVGATSYIVTQRDVETGKYKEEEIVYFGTNVTKQLELPEQERNNSKNWSDMVNYWKNVICRNDPTPILNATDWSGAISLTYLSVGLDRYAARQAQRMFAFSRFYNYELTSPMSPEIISGVENKETLPWVYSSDQSTNIVDPITGKTLATLYWPSTFGIAAIPPLSSTRLRGYGDLIPIGYCVETGKVLSSVDLYFEPDEWVKYIKPFDLILDNILNFEYYKDLISSSSILNDPSKWPYAWCSSTATLSHYYDLLWSCFTGHSAEEEYFGNDFLKDYPKEYFNINSVLELNERFLQFKYYSFYRALKEQKAILYSQPFSQEEKQAKLDVANNQFTQMYESALKIKHSDNDWFAQTNPNTTSELPSFIEENTQIPDFQLMHDTLTKLKAIVKNEVSVGTITKEEGDEIIANSSLPQFYRTTNMFKSISNTKEKYLFSSLDKPDRSAKFNGAVYTEDEKWYSYWNTLLAPVGQNMQWFFYKSHETIKYWIYAIIWGTISLIGYAGGVLIYNKYDVK